MEIIRNKCNKNKSFIYCFFNAHIGNTNKNDVQYYRNNIFPIELEFEERVCVRCERAYTADVRLRKNQFLMPKPAPSGRLEFHTGTGQLSFNFKNNVITNQGSFGPLPVQQAALSWCHDELAIASP